MYIFKKVYFSPIEVILKTIKNILHANARMFMYFKQVPMYTNKKYFIIIKQNEL